MATIFGVTSLPLTPDGLKSFSDALISDLSMLYTHALSCNIVRVPQEDCRGDSCGQTTFFVCVPPYISLEKKRQTIALINNTITRIAGPQGKLKVVVLFQYHDDDGVGKDGELFADIKKTG